MFDVFYMGTDPGLFAHEQLARSLEHAQSMSRTRYFWIVNNLCDYSNFDFTWEPVPWQAHQRHAWASQWQKDCGTYLVPKAGFADTNYHCDVVPVCADMSKWTVPTAVADFDYSWHPDATEPPYHYVFGTQWQKTGGPEYRMPGATEVKYVTQVRATTRATAAVAYVIDHIDGNASQVADQISIPVARVLRYFDNYKDTLLRLTKSIPEDQEYVWICSSVCDYTSFDFSWHPKLWQSHMLHVFASNNQKFGDTFFMHVPTFKQKIDQIELLDWYDLNFVTEISVPRRAMPVVQHTGDTHVDAVQTMSWSGPLAVFTNRSIGTAVLPTVPLWREKTKTVVPLDPAASVVIVPRPAVSYVKTQLYDYPHIDRTCRNTLTSLPLDIVFIANGESNAEANWHHLSQCVTHRPNRLTRVDNVPGRAAAYRAAAQASSTAWFFAVFAKLEVSAEFDWAWQPDCLQQPKHYIFHAHNPVTGLEYGHMAMIAYNCKLTLSNPAQGLDFTLEQPHEVVPILSGTARYADDPWTAWRTAFREAVKLRQNLPNIESQYRLNRWLASGTGPMAAWSQQGARDGVAYYEAVSGDFASLRRTYEWSWLADYLYCQHKLSPDQLCSLLPSPTVQGR
jgi:hypothetical protein